LSITKIDNFEFYTFFLDSIIFAYMHSISPDNTLLFNKPLGWTSFDAVGFVRKVIGIKKVGHAGTLDPLATGLLIICTGKNTKLINEFMGQPKQYTGTFTLGATTASYDRESLPENEKPFQHITLEQIQAATKKFMGDILQLPPRFSAIKQEGKPIYLAARKGVDIKLEPRPVTIYNFEITALKNNEAHFIIDCSTGTYIRSLAHDLGQELGCGAYLSSLCRTAIGKNLLSEAFTPETLIVNFAPHLKDMPIKQGRIAAKQ
jgi:tRNA pseudouridine55 synthase